METNFSRVSSLPAFSVENYPIWRFRLTSYLTAQHCRMWEVITSGPIVIREKRTRVGLGGQEEPYIEERVKDKADFTSEERKQDELDNLAKNIISGTVPDKYVTKIMGCSSAKEMWDILERMCAGSEEIKENKLTIACQKFDSFRMSRGQSIEEMEFSFNKILNEVQAISKEKYTQREINLKVLRGLPPGDWQMYAVAHQNKPGFNKLSTEQLFSDLKANEFDIRRMRESTKAVASDEDTPQASKGAALKAASKETRRLGKEKDETSEDLQSQYALMTERFNKLESRVKKFNKFRKKNFKGKEYQPKYSRDRAEDKRASSTDTRDVECFGCGKKGHYKTECPEISHAERKALRAKRDKKFEKKKAMVADDAENSSSTSTSTSSNSTSSSDESQALMARDIDSYNNGIDDSEVNSNFNSAYTDVSLMAGEESSSDESSFELDEIEEVMCDYKVLKVLYEDQLKENEGLKAERAEAQKELKKISTEVPDENGLDEFIMEIMEKEKTISLLKKEKSAEQLLLDETKTELGRCQAELLEAKNLATRLKEKVEQYVKETMRLSPINNHFPSPNLIDAVSGKLTAKEKGKKIVEDQPCSEDVSEDESVDWNKIEDDKRRMRVHRDVPPPKTYQRSKRPPWNVNYPTKKPSQPWKKVEGSTKQFAYSRANQVKAQYGHQAEYKKLRPVQHRAEADNQRLKSAQSGKRNHKLNPNQFVRYQHGRRNHKLNPTQFARPQYRRKEETSRPYQSQRFTQQVWKRHSFQKQPQFHRDHYHTDLYYRTFNRKRPEKNEKLKKKEQRGVPKDAKKINEDKASTSRQRRIISSTSARTIRQIWVPKGTANQQGPKY